MLPAGAAPSLADRLVTACSRGDLRSAKSAVAEGASVNENGKVAPVGLWDCPLPPLAAVTRYTRHQDVVVWLLSRGADPNGPLVMGNAARQSTAAVLQLLIDAGGDVNRNCSGAPLFCAVEGNGLDKVRVLLAQPSLDFTIEFYGYTPEQYARDYCKPVMADMIAQEVSDVTLTLSLAGADVVSVCGAVVAAQRARRAALVRPDFC